MNPPDPLAHDSLLDEQAAEWLFERDEGFAPGRAEAFVEWCNTDPRHAEAVGRVEQTLCLLDEMPTVRVPLEQRVTSLAPSPAPWHKPLFWAAGFAAVLALGAFGWRLLPSAPHTFTADAAAPTRIALSDGTVIDLNAASTFTERFTAGERRVTLTAGEAHFQVAHNPSRPFLVTANGVTVRAVGTAFNVRLTATGADVLVTEGRVKLDWVAPVPEASAAVLPALSAGERTSVSTLTPSVPAVEEVPPAQVNTLLSWQDTMTSFTDVPLREMVARVNRCNATQLALADPSLGDRRIGGVINLHQVDAFVRLLEQEGDIVSERRYTGEIVLRRAR